MFLLLCTAEYCCRTRGSGRCFSVCGGRGNGRDAAPKINMSSSGRKTQINQKCFKLFLYIFSAGKKKKEKGKSMSKRSFSFVSSSFLVLRGHHQQINPMFSFFFSCVSWSRFRQCGNYPGPRYADEEPYLPLSQVPSVRRPIDIGLDLIASAGNK